MNATPSDFNDMANLRGAEAVRALLEPLATGDVTNVTDVHTGNGAAHGVTSPETATVEHVAVPAIPTIDERPRFLVFDDQHEAAGESYRAGVWHFGTVAGKGEMSPFATQHWVCTPLHVLAVTFDSQHNNYGRLLRFRNTSGGWREWAMPMELLRGSGEELRGELLGMGVCIEPTAHRLLGQYLQAREPQRRMRCATQVGWCEGSYVLPDRVIGPGASDVIFQCGERGHDEHTLGGTLDGWRAEVAVRAVGNPLLTLALSASFAGPLLAKCHAESGGLHLVGDSSTGKTTAIEAACATWGGSGYKRSWRATANGMEGAAALFNDCLLAIDEISECDPREVGAIVYALGNGRGKQRASRSGSARGVTRWRCVVLSSGERTIATTMAEGGHRAKAGQSVRLLDLPASRTYGAWDELHGYETGSGLSDAIKTAAATHHGHAGREFVRAVAFEDTDHCAELEHFKQLPEFAAHDGQEKRAAARFALFAMAGELATKHGVTGWPSGIATHAAAEGFRAWKSLRGGGNDERRQILERVGSFIERHGDSRFSSVHESDHARVNDRAGWWRENAESGRVYLFNADGMREALKGFEFKHSLDILQESGALPPADGTGERAKPQRVAGRTVRLYEVRADRLV